MVRNASGPRQHDNGSAAPDAAAQDRQQRLADGAACLQAAISYLQRGWSVLALCPPNHAGVGKTHGRRCKSPGKAPWGEWKEFEDRLPTEAELRKKWKDNPTLNVGLALGPVPGLVRLDVDGPGGERQLAEYSNGDLPPTLEFTSGRPEGGRGILYAIPPGMTFQTTPETGGEEKGELRFQAKGAQTVLPPSRHKDGPLYAWKPGHGPDEIEAAPAPAWVVERWGVHGNGHERNGAPKARTSRRATTLGDDEVLEEGRRDTVLTSLAGTMRRRGMALEEIEAALLAVNERRCRPPLGAEQVAKIAVSIAAKNPADPMPTGPPPAPEDLQRLEEVVAQGAAAFFEDKTLLVALASLATSDPAAYEARRAFLKEHGISVRAVDNALRPLRREQARQRPPAFALAGYEIDDGRTCRKCGTNDGGAKLVPLCNFAASITEVITHDDGVEQRAFFTLAGTTDGGRELAPVQVPAAEFPGPSWVTPGWHGEAVVFAGQGTHDHLRAAIELLSPNRTRRVVHTHTGWRRVGEVMVYLHGGGAIGPDGPVAGVEVLLPDSLDRLCLPEPPAGEALVAAVQGSVGLLDAKLAPERVMFPILAAAYRAVLGEMLGRAPDFSIHLAGKHGGGKTELATLMQQHFGASVDVQHLPSNWGSTANAMGEVGFVLKDMLCVVDDYAPRGAIGDRQRAEGNADRLLRSQANHASRLRLNRDCSLRANRPPRSLILSTGEDIPFGESLRGRMLAPEVAKGDVPLPRLTPYQAEAASGLYARAMAGFVRWLAGRHAELSEQLPARRAKFREGARVILAKRGPGSPRTSGIVADLGLALGVFFDFAVEVGALAPAERKALGGRCSTALIEAATRHAEHVVVAEATGMFLRLLGSAIRKTAHVADMDGEAPRGRERAWGYQLHESGRGDFATSEWRPLGQQVGWLDGENLYLDPETSYAVAQDLGRRQGESLAVNAQTLCRRLKEEGLLVGFDDGRTTARATLQGQRRSVLWLRATALWGREGDASAVSPEANGSASAGKVGTVGTVQNEGVQVPPRARTPTPPPDTRLYFRDEAGRPCAASMCHEWCWEGGADWFLAAEHPVPCGAVDVQRARATTPIPP
jgi:hypothetical protein